jgi:hypothetical protein
VHTSEFLEHALSCPVKITERNSSGNNNNTNNKNGTCKLIDVAIPGDRNVIQKEAEKILKYKDLTLEIQRKWYVKARVIPVIIGGTGISSKSFRKYVSTTPENHEVKELHTTAILGTAHILQKVLGPFSARRQYSGPLL